MTSHDCIVTETFDDNYNITDLPDSVEPVWTFLAVFNSIAAPPTTVLNFLIIWTIVSDKELRKVSHNILLATLAMNDLLVGLIVEPIFSWYLVAFLKRRSILCHFLVYAVPALVLGFLTLSTLALASIDVFVAVEYPQFYREHASTKNILIGSSIFCLVNVSLSVVGTVLLNYQAHLKKISAGIVVAINIIIILCSSIKVQITAYRQRCTIRAQAQAVEPNPSTEENRQRRQYKQALTVGMIVVATILLYCPFIINTAIEFALRESTKDAFQFIAFATELTFVHLQSLVNPIVISLRLSYIREGVKKKLLCQD